MDQQLDLRQTASETWADRTLERFDELDPGHGFVLCTASDPGAVLERLQKQRSGAYEWHPLLDGPGEWRVVVARRRAAPGQRNVMEFMTTDHRRVHAMLAELLEQAGGDDPRGLARSLAHLETGLRRHFDVEEQVLFPVIAAKLGTPRGPAALLRDEHLLAFDMLETLGRLCQQGPSRRERVVELARGLQDLLANHSGVEERILYAVTDLLLTEEERDELVKRCQRF